MYYFFLISVQYFVIKFCLGVLGITLIIPNIFLTSCPHLLEYFGAYFGILRLLFENGSIFSVKSCTDVLGVLFEGHCTISFHVMTLLANLKWVFLGLFWAIFI